MKRLITPLDAGLILFAIVLVLVAVGFRWYKLQDYNRLQDSYYAFPIWIHPQNKLSMGFGKLETFTGQFYGSIYNGEDASNSSVVLQLVEQVNNQPRWLYLKVNQALETMESFQLIDKNGLYGERVIDELGDFMNDKYYWEVVAYSNEVEVADAQRFVSITVKEL